METLQLTNDEKNILESVYGRQVAKSGYNPRKLETVKELTAQEKKFFEGKNFVSSHFFIQTLYKVRGVINPMKFSITINRMFRDNENLRANFCNLGTRTVKVIRPATAVKPEILFRNITNLNDDELDDEFTKIFEADIRREIDFMHDPLIRFAVYKTNSDEFALFVTMAQVISDSFDAGELFCKLFDLPDEIKPKKISDQLPLGNYDTIREYWTKILDKAPPPSNLPYEKKETGTYRQRAFHATLPADLLSDLLGFAQSNRLMLMVILQSAWGFMLQLTNKRRDCLFCQVSSGGNFSLNFIPVRLTVDDNLTVEQIVRQQFRQFIVSQSYSFSDWTILDELTVQKKLFNHVISFKEFIASELNYAKYAETPAEPFGKIIFQSSFNSQDMKLSLYFRYSKKKLLIYFLYDAEAFPNGGVEKLYKLYTTILQQMVTDWNAKFSTFLKTLFERAEAQREIETVSPENERKKVRDFLSQMPILQGRYGGTIGLFEEHSKIITFYEGDRISGEMLEKNFIFVASGVLSRNVDTGDGWYNTLDIIERNCFINPTSFLEKRLATFSATVLSDQAELLLIPHDILFEKAFKNPDIALSLMKHALEQMERWQVLWVQS